MNPLALRACVGSLANRGMRFDFHISCAAFIAFHIHGRTTVSPRLVIGGSVPYTQHPLEKPYGIQ
jgi:hypothetical protein